MPLKNIFKTTLLSTLTVLISVLVIFAVVKAGSLTPSSSPAATLYTLADIYTRLTTNATATEANHSLNPATTPTATFYTLKQIYDAIPTIDATKILQGTAYLGIAGTMANNGVFSLTPSTANQTVTAGYYSGGTLAGDADLVAENIKSGTDIFGVAGSLSSGSVGVTKTGQVTVYATNDDGTSQSGLTQTLTDVIVNSLKVAVNDASTGLMWQKCSAGLSGDTCATGSATTMAWTDAILYCDNLKLCNDGTYQGNQSGQGDCTTHSGELYTNWKLPNIKELFTTTVEEAGAVTNVKASGAPYINQTYFPATISSYYWSSTTNPSNTTLAFNVYYSAGTASSTSKTLNTYVRCARGQ